MNLTSTGNYYRLVWRWHFYAGIIVAPFVLILSLTGLIYLFNDEINDIWYRDLRIVPQSAQTVPLSTMVDSAQASVEGGRATRIDTPTEPGRSAMVFVTPANGEPLRVFVDPSLGRVLGSYVYKHTLVGFADLMHGSLLLGDFGDAMVELAACWAFILIVTGLYLWWPRRNVKLTSVLLPVWRAKGRPFWKSAHATVGLWTAFLTMFLIITGLPWATNWGGLFRQATDAAGIGYPRSFRGHGAPTSSVPATAATQGAAPWTLAQAPLPVSDAHSDHHGGHAAPAVDARKIIGIDRVGEILQQAGMTNPYRLTFPKGDRGVYAAFVYPDQPETQRTVYIDQYSGAIIGDVHFADYGIAAKAVELGVQIHMGNYFGRANQLLMVIPCLGLIFLSITGPYMWLLRRPRGRIGAPDATDAGFDQTLAVLILGMACIFPLAGASLLVISVVDTGGRRWYQSTQRQKPNL